MIAKYKEGDTVLFGRVPTEGNTDTRMKVTIYGSQCYKRKTHAYLIAGDKTQLGWVDETDLHEINEETTAGEQIPAQTKEPTNVAI